MTDSAHPAGGEGTSGTRRGRRSARLALGARRHPLVAEVGRRFDGQASLPAGAAVLIGVSGGADSTALLLACAALRARGSSRGGKRGARLEPIVGHVHHHLRGESADADAAFVEKLCASLEVPLRVEHVQPGRETGNVEAVARRMRYESLRCMAQAAGAKHVAVAHHGEDQLETMLIALCRGAGLEGLSGMAWSRLLGEGITLLRPLLASRKSECEDLCRAAGIAWREDPMNTDIAQARARLRRDVLPVLEALWPDAARRASGAADLIESARQLVEARLDEVFGRAGERAWTRTRLRRLPVALLAAGLRRAAVHEEPRVADELGQKQLLPAAEAIAGRQRRPKRFDWPGGLVLHITAREVRLERGADMPEGGEAE